MPVIYNDQKIIPGPFIQYSKEAIEDGSGKYLSAVWNIQLRGKLCADKGSPNSSGIFWTAPDYPPDEVIDIDSRLTAIANKQKALIHLFSDNGKTLEIDGYDGFNCAKFNPRIKKIEFPDGEGKGANWTNYSEYIITMEADADPDSGVVTKTEDVWNVEPLDEKTHTFRLTHRVSAAGRVHYDENGDIQSEGWEVAQDYVLNKIGLGLDPSKMIASGVLNADDLTAYNFVRSQEVNEADGTFAVTETWVCYAGGTAIEEFTVNSRYAVDTGKTTVTVEGTITGLDTDQNFETDNRFTQATTKWGSVIGTVFARAGNYAGVTLNPTPLETSVGYQAIAGVITYNYVYDNRPAPPIAGSLTSQITTTDHAAGDVYASIPVIGAPLGPVLQNIATITAKRREISVEAVMPSTYGAEASEPSTNSLVLTYVPDGTDVFLDSDVKSFSVQTGRYTRQVTWTYK